MLTGSCLCGRVRYEIDGPMLVMGYCHCANCRKFTGSAFSAGGRVAAESFRWMEGEDLVQRYESSPGVHRCFCRHCGSSLASMPEGMPHVGVYSGSLDCDPEARPALHLFVASKAPWFEIGDDLPRFDAFPGSPGR
jgi:hypothetical protein